MNDSLRSPDLGHLLPGVLALAESAGAAIMEIYRDGDLGETRKQDDSPLTLADLASHRLIVRGLEELTPDIPILSEEEAAVPYAERAGWPRFWLVDPLDGTKEFIKRNGEFTVNIGLIEHGAPVLGVVYAPVLGVSYFAARGAGAFVRRGAETLPISVRRMADGEPVGVVASRSHADPRTAALIARLGDHQCVSMGSSLKLCLVAEGAAHLYPRLGPTMEWDTAAAHAVVAQAGGTVSDLDGAELRYGKADLHNPEFYVCHADHRQKLQELVARSLSEAGAGGIIQPKASTNTI
jgi:3'(2'), 5'-bisphosphate nucleotidase